MIHNTRSFYISIILTSFLGIFNLSAENLFFTDSIPPAPTLNAGSLTVGGPFSVGVGFSEEVFGLTAENLFVENGEVIEISGSEMNYTVCFRNIIGKFYR